MSYLLRVTKRVCFHWNRKNCHLWYDCLMRVWVWLLHLSLIWRFEGEGVKLGIIHKPAQLKNGKPYLLNITNCIHISILFSPKNILSIIFFLYYTHTDYDLFKTVFVINKMFLVYTVSFIANMYIFYNLVKLF